MVLCSESAACTCGDGVRPYDALGGGRGVLLSGGIPLGALKILKNA